MPATIDDPMILTEIKEDLIKNNILNKKLINKIQKSKILLINFVTQNQA